MDNTDTQLHYARKLYISLYMAYSDKHSSLIHGSINNSGNYFTIWTSDNNAKV